MDKRNSPTLIRDKEIDLALSFLFFSLAVLSSAMVVRNQDPLARIQGASSAILNILVGSAFAIRKGAVEETNRNEYLVPTSSFILPFLILNIPLLMSAEYSLPLGLVIAIPATVLGAVSIVYLRRSFAILPAVRRIVCTGPYRIIRHPIYLAEMLYVFGYMLLRFNTVSLVLYLMFVVCTLWRIRIEEEKLRKHASYRRFMHGVKYRLVPGIY